MARKMKVKCQVQLGDMPPTVFPQLLCLLPSHITPLGVKPAVVLNEVIIDEAYVVSTALGWSRLLRTFEDHGKHLTFHQNHLQAENKKQINYVVLLENKKPIISFQ